VHFLSNSISELFFRELCSDIFRYQKCGIHKTCKFYINTVKISNNIQLFSIFTPKVHFFTFYDHILRHDYAEKLAHADCQKNRSLKIPENGP